MIPATCDLGLKYQCEQEKANVLRRIMLSATYRTASSKIQKVEIILSSEFNFSVQEACKTVGISTKTYYQSKHSDENRIIIEKSAPSQLLTDIEEKNLISIIENAQLNFNCLNGKSIREIAENMFFERTSIRRQFNKNWFQTFMERYQTILGKMKCTSVDEERGNISPEKVKTYINDVINALKNITELRLFINMDECGFGRRTNYKKRRTCVFLKNCKVPPAWRGETDNYHVSWVCGISGATYTRHMFVSTRKTMDQEFYETFLTKFGEFTFSPKGYLTERNMIEWIQNHLIPYVLQIRGEIGNDNHPVVLMMDNLEQHFTQNVIAELEKIKPYILIPLPPHSSHLTQPCDACIFSSAKSKYNQISYPACNSKFVAKLLRIQSAIKQTFSEEMIISSWKHCGFTITIEKGNCTKL